MSAAVWPDRQVLSWSGKWHVPRRLNPAAPRIRRQLVALCGRSLRMRFAERDGGVQAACAAQLEAQMVADAADRAVAIAAGEPERRAMPRCWICEQRRTCSPACPAVGMSCGRGDLMNAMRSTGALRASWRVR